MKFLPLIIGILFVVGFFIWDSFITNESGDIYTSTIGFWVTAIVAGFVIIQIGVSSYSEKNLSRKLFTLTLLIVGTIPAIWGLSLLLGLVH